MIVSAVLHIHDESAVSSERKTWKSFCVGCKVDRMGTLALKVTLDECSCRGTTIFMLVGSL